MTLPPSCSHPSLFIRDDGICVGCNQFDGQADALEGLEE